MYSQNKTPENDTIDNCNEKHGDDEDDDGDVSKLSDQLHLQALSPPLGGMDNADGGKKPAYLL